MMKPANSTRLITALFLATALAGLAIAHEEKIQLTDAPAAVQQAIKAELGSNPAEKITREKEDGRMEYEVEYKKDGRDASIKLDEAGKIIEKEINVDPASLPAPVIAALKTHYPTAKILEAEKAEPGAYEIKIQVGPDKHKIELNADGNFAASEKHEAKQDDETEEGEEHESPSAHQADNASNASAAPAAASSN